MIAVSDTSPLSYLVLVGEGDLLGALFDEIWIPPVVADELAHPALRKPAAQSNGSGTASIKTAPIRSQGLEHWLH